MITALTCGVARSAAGQGDPSITEVPMLVALLILAALLLLGAIYRIRAAWKPFTTHGRRRVLYWGRGWWRGDQAQNRDEY